jgi:cytochrome c biogenesis protein CcdA
LPLLPTFYGKNLRGDFLKKKSFISILFLFILIPIVNAQSTIKLPIFGEISAELPIPLLGAILGLIDGGFNPCALSVLFFLIAYLMALGSRKKCLLIGLTYSFMIFVVYFLFMYGVLNVISIIGYLEVIKTVVGVLIIIAGILEIKDFFWYGKFASLEIPKFAKSPIEKLTKAATIPSAILLGILVSLVEIPCAGAFPLIYLTILAKTSGVMNVLYLLWYNFFFILPLIVLVVVFYFGLLKVEEAEERRIKLRKYMRLIAGLIMLSLGSAMLLRVI